MQSECFLYSSPKAGLNGVLHVGVGKGQNAKHYQFVAYSMPMIAMNDRLLLLLGFHNCCYLVSNARASKLIPTLRATVHDVTQRRTSRRLTDGQNDLRTS